MANQIHRPCIRMDTQLILGTAQLGMRYGIANRDGKPSTSRAYDILRSAWQEGISMLDTAPDYGESEEIIGRFGESHSGNPSIITKLPSVCSHVKGEDSLSVSQYVAKSLDGSLQRLKRDKVACYLIHDEQDIPTFGEELFEALQVQKEKGKIDRVGASVYSPAIAETAIDSGKVGVLEIPTNLFDHRFESVARKGEGAGVSVLARSVFLQGLFFLSPKEAGAKVPGADVYIRKLQSYAQEISRPIAELALCFVRDNPYIDGLVIGVDSVSQLKKNVELMTAPGLLQKTRKEIRKTFSELPNSIVNPAKW